jgi:hypothetical protein
MGPLLYADDNLTPVALTDASRLRPILSLYNEYTGFSGINVNTAKTTALIITPAPLHEQLCPLGNATPGNAKHLRILLGKTIDSTVKATMVDIELKAIKLCIMATRPPLTCYTEPHSSPQLCSLFTTVSFYGHPSGTHTYCRTLQGSSMLPMDQTY